MSLSLSNSGVQNSSASSGSDPVRRGDTGAARTRSDKNDDAKQAKTNHNKSNISNHDALDFIASDQAVKKIFSLPYATTGQSISVAVHNLDGTLLIDSDHDIVEFSDSGSEQHINGMVPPLSFSSSAPQHGEGLRRNSDNLYLIPISTVDTTSERGALAILNSIFENTAKPTLSDLTAANHLLDARHAPVISTTDSDSQYCYNISCTDKDETKSQTVPQQLVDLPLPEDYINSYTPPTTQPRQYISWRCRDMNLLIGSNALIYRTPTGEATLTLRVADVQELNHLLQQHQEAVQCGEFLADHQRPAWQQQGKPSYAQAVTAAEKQLQLMAGASNAGDEHDGDHNDDDDEVATNNKASTKTNRDESAGFAAPDLDQVQLQSCIVPSSLPLGGRLGSSMAARRGPASPNVSLDTHNALLSPVSTVIDAYLDNIMANVPQLALCLQEKGFVQSIKLLQTSDIPSGLLWSSTLDMTRPFDLISPDTEAERLFSPQIMEMNALALLRFLKTNCTRNNTTYLLRREAGETNLQLYDISSISAQKQREWIWWLAMMSYRFANRLCDISRRTTADLSRACRNRQRSLLENALELLEVLSDMDGNPRRSLVAAIREHLADTFLWEGSLPVNAGENHLHHGGNRSAATPMQSSRHHPPTTFSQRHPFKKVSLDALEKAQTHLEKGIKCLWPVLEQNIERQQQRRQRRRDKSKHPSIRSKKSSVKVTTETEGKSSDSEIEEKSSENEAVTTQLFGLHVKLVNLYLHLAEIHLKNYFSSSAMQSLRFAARRLADSFFLIGETLGPQGGHSSSDSRTHAWVRRSQLQYVWLWEHCGHFARSFGADSLWRERGHAGATDVLYVLQDAEAAFTKNKRLCFLQQNHELYSFLAGDELCKGTDGEINFYNLSGIVNIPPNAKKTPLSSEMSEYVRAATDHLSAQHILQREEREVLVASCLSYQRAIATYKILMDDISSEATSDLMGLLQQRLGDACNEVGKNLLNALRSLLGPLADSAKPAAGPLLSSSCFWFQKGLECFKNCGDLRNLALLRCNLCQCQKLRANAIFALDSSQAWAHAEKCLQEGANHLLAAHEVLGMREMDPLCWDMVSGELAATFLVLGVRRRQALIGSGNVPLILEALRLSPGKERSIVEPITRAMEIYEEMGNSHQVGASHYQLALYYSKIWTCQRDESKTREKLGAAFSHYSAAHSYFSRSLAGNESTFCLLCLDLSSLYASVQGESGISKALLCCFDTSPTFSPETVKSHAQSKDSKEWLKQMATLASEVEDRVFKLLRNLVKVDEEKQNKTPSRYKIIYREGLIAKMKVGTSSDGYDTNENQKQIEQWHFVLNIIQDLWHQMIK